MSNYSSIISKYKEQSVTTMTPLELLILLYDEAIKHINLTETANQVSQSALFEKELAKAVEIIMYLDNTLDFEYEISFMLHKLYEYMTFELNNLRIHYDVTKTKAIKSMLLELKNTFLKAGTSACLEGN